MRNLYFLYNLSLSICLISIGMAITTFFLPEKWELFLFERFIYISLYLTFAVAFGLFYQNKNYLYSAKKRKLWLLAIFVSFCLFTALILAFKGRLQKGQNWMLNPGQETATIYKIDPEGFGKKRKVHYVFYYHWNAYDGVCYDTDKIYSIGDTLNILFSKDNPDQNLAR